MIGEPKSGEKMPCKIFEDEGLFAVIWNRVTPADIRHVVKVGTAHYEANKKRLLFVGIIPPFDPPPDETTREAFLPAIEALERVSYFHYIVYGGTGFSAAVIRSIIAVQILARRRKKEALVARSLEEAIEKTQDEGRKRILNRLSRMLKGAGFASDGSRLSAA